MSKLNVKELRDMLIDNFVAYNNGTLDLIKAREAAAQSTKILACAKAEQAFDRHMGIRKNIEFLNTCEPNQAITAIQLEKASRPTQRPKVMLPEPKPQDAFERFTQAELYKMYKNGEIIIKKK